LIDFIETENAIYFYRDSHKHIADKASYYGYPCFNVNKGTEIYVLLNAFESNFVQDITDLPKEAYTNSGSSIKPVGKLKDVLNNMKTIFEALDKSYDELVKEVEEKERELEEKLDELSEDERLERLNEISKLKELSKQLKNANDYGEEESGAEKKSKKEIKKTKKHYKSSKIKKFKDSKEHYLTGLKFGNDYYDICFANIDNKDTSAHIIEGKYIALNLNNKYIKVAFDEENPIKQLILFLPDICHEVSHTWSYEHNEIFQMVFNSLLVASMTNLLKMI
jgi:Skp family chaperone for outer membrane proteins